MRTEGTYHKMRANVRVDAGPRLFMVVAASVLVTATAGDARAIDSDEEPSAPEPVFRPEPGPPPATYGPAVVERDDVVVELGGLVGYASRPIRGATTPLGAGIGGRLGLELYGVYLGVRVIGYFGGTDIDVSDHTVLYGTELGYGFRFGKLGGGYFTLRPQVGFGGAVISHTDPSTVARTTAKTSTKTASVDMISSASSSSSSSAGTPSDTVTVRNLYVEPGLTAMFSAGAHFVALTTNVLVIPGISYGGTEGTTWISYGLHAQLGFRF